MGWFIPMWAALIALALLRLSACFVPSSVSLSDARPMLRHAAPAVSPMPDLSSQRYDKAGIAVATVAILAAMSRKAKSKGVKPLTAVVLPRTSPTALEGSSAGSAFAGLSVLKESRSPDVSRNFYPTTCKLLYFRRRARYMNEHRRVIRNRAYNLYFRNKYKRKSCQAIFAMRYLFDSGSTFKPTSVKHVKKKLKSKMDIALIWIERAAVQGTIKPWRAKMAKEKLFNAMLQFCIGKKLIKPTRDELNFTPAYKLLEYELPVIHQLREPRPWQLPGWKSVYELKTEYDKWLEKSGRTAAADA